MGFPRQEYWSGLPCSPPGDLPDPEIELVSLMSHALAGRFFTTSTTWEAIHTHTHTHTHIHIYVVAQLVKNWPAMQETPVQLLGREDPLDKG